MCQEHTKFRSPFHGAFCHPPNPEQMGNIGNFLHDTMKHVFRGFGSQVPYNVEDQGEIYLITVLLPGRGKEDVDISLIGNNLHIKAEKPSIAGVSSKNKQDKFLNRLFTFIDVDMEISLPGNADETKIKPKIVNGVLLIKVSKKVAKNIDINDTDNN